MKLAKKKIKVFKINNFPTEISGKSLKKKKKIIKRKSTNEFTSAALFSRF